MEESHRDSKGRFKPGHKHNHKHKLSIRELRKLASSDELNQIVRSLVDDALAGDKEAREWVANRLVPQVRPQMEKAEFQLDASSLESAAKSVLSAISKSQISADIGESLMRSLSVAGNLGQMAAMSQRLVDLEARVDGRTVPKDVTPTLPPASTVEAPGESVEVSVAHWREHAQIIED